ncbi:MAG: hypothetical protein HKL88_00020 [Bacteroidia bacterium]|nr:hypothetical protein [Bacteroidia bacterium]
MKNIIILIAGLLLFSNLPAYSQCACCSSVGCGDNSVESAIFIPQGKWLLSASSNISGFKPLSPQQIQQDAQASSMFNVYNENNRCIYLLGISYGISNRFNARVVLPYSSINGLEQGMTGQLNPVSLGASNGISNLQASLQYLILRREYCAGWEAITSVGLIAPTGIHNNIGANGVLLEDPFQPGADSWVPVLGIIADRKFAHTTLVADASYVFKSSSPNGTVDAEYWTSDLTAYTPLLRTGGKLKHSCDSTGSCSKEPRQSNFILNMFYGIQFEHVGQDIMMMPDGSNAPGMNIGAFRTYADAGVEVTLNGRFFIPVSIALPFYQSVNGYQVKVSWRVNACLSYLL